MLLVSFEAPSDSESRWGREHGRSIPFSEVVCASQQFIEKTGGRHLAALPRRSSGERLHAKASRPVGVVSRRSRHRTRPWSISSSGTAKVGIMTSG